MSKYDIKLTPEKFIGLKVQYDEAGQTIWGVDKKEGLQHLLTLRGWGGIQQHFKNTRGQVDIDKAVKFQDEVGEWIVDAINQKLNPSNSLDVLKSISAALLLIENSDLSISGVQMQRLAFNKRHKLDEIINSMENGSKSNS